MIRLPMLVSHMMWKQFYSITVCHIVLEHDVFTTMPSWIVKLVHKHLMNPLTIDLASVFWTSFHSDSEVLFSLFSCNNKLLSSWACTNATF